MAASSPSPSPPPVRAGEVFRAFLALGSTAFGGPIAHIGYLRRAFVLRRRWLDESRFAQLLAVCQFLPGPASSQLALAIGLQRDGGRGALQAFAGFTLPSALLMGLLAALSPRLDAPASAAALHGLALVAVAVVAHGVVGMARQLANDVPRAAIAIVAAALVLAGGTAWMQLVAIAFGALAGRWACRTPQAPPAAAFVLPYGLRTAAVCLALFLAGLVASLLVPPGGAPTLAGLAAAFYRAGALVFGGGHVVLPLLQQSVVEPGWIAQDAFLAGYGAAQAMPGPMFSLSAYLGALVELDAPAWIGATVALLAVFLPGFLLLAVLPAWSAIAAHPGARRAVAGVNAAVVGLLAAALYDPVWTHAIDGPLDIAIAAATFGLLASGRLPVLAVVAACVGMAMLAGLR
ncbi:chromate efflux transporter [Pseudoxanthomonas kaohsiungensis]|uniref:Chromate efflux transporter n=1 Tax=Pseudoxanthomonas kaohsiungensis TaxID=283923 RepID=A0ABW3LZ44_9GAMM|nr:chromate efflux transporter [Pseudoxanthomonas kaohsiungensis]KAF1701197.1 chromate transporter [Pseudoxanthomonas kaohsiungensis]